MILGLGGPPCTSRGRLLQAADPGSASGRARTRRRMPAMELDVLVTEGLGDASYIFTWGDEAAVVDPQRDVERFVDAAAARATIRHVVETRPQRLRLGRAGASSGDRCRDLGAGQGRIRVRASIGGGQDRDPVRRCNPPRCGDTRPYPRASRLPPARRRATDGPVLGGERHRRRRRPDRSARSRTHGRAHAAAVPLDAAAREPVGRVRVLPTHGAGSFCAVGSPGERRTSTIAEERATNPSFTETDEDAFVRRQLTGLMAFPDYYANMAPISRAGPPVLGAPRRPGR